MTGFREKGNRLIHQGGVDTPERMAELIREALYYELDAELDAGKVGAYITSAERTNSHLVIQVQNQAEGSEIPISTFKVTVEGISETKPTVRAPHGGDDQDYPQLTCLCGNSPDGEWGVDGHGRGPRLELECGKCGRIWVESAMEFTLYRGPRDEEE